MVKRTPSDRATYILQAALYSMAGKYTPVLELSPESIHKLHRFLQWMDKEWKKKHVERKSTWKELWQIGSGDTFETQVGRRFNQTWQPFIPGTNWELKPENERLAFMNKIRKELHQERLEAAKARRTCKSTA